MCALQSRMGTSCTAYGSCRSKALASYQEANQTVAWRKWTRCSACQVKATEAELQAMWSMLQQARETLIRHAGTEVRCMVNAARQRKPSKVNLCASGNFSVAHLHINYSTAFWQGLAEMLDLRCPPLHPARACLSHLGLRNICLLSMGTCPSGLTSNVQLLSCLHSARSGGPLQPSAELCAVPSPSTWA